jgi:hypothetical protein
MVVFNRRRRNLARWRLLYRRLWGCTLLKKEMLRGVHHPDLDHAYNPTHHARYLPCAIKVATARCSPQFDQVGLFEARGVVRGAEVLIGR